MTIDTDLDRFRQHLDAGPSATAQLRDWSRGDVRLGRVRRRLRRAAPEEAALVDLPRRTTVQHRVVALVSPSGVVLSHAVAVVVLGRLPLAAVMALVCTRRPLGDVLRAAGGFERTAISERVSTGSEVVLRRMAVLHLAGRPVAVVHEVYPHHVLRWR